VREEPLLYFARRPDIDRLKTVQYSAVVARIFTPVRVAAFIMPVVKPARAGAPPMSSIFRCWD
jgi:hypothetical protein